MEFANSAFQNCIRFEAVNLPKLTEIKSFALQNKALVNIELNSINNDEYNSKMKQFADCKSLVQVTMLYARLIRQHIFKNCINLYSIKFTKAFNVQNNAFMNCISLTKIFLNEGCIHLSKLNLPNSRLIL